MIRFLLALVAVLTLSVPALAQGPGDPLAFVQAVFRPITDADFAGETAEQDRGIYSASLQALLDVDAQRDMNYLDFDWVFGGQDLPDMTELKIVQLRRTEAAASYRVTFRNYGETRERIVHLVVENDRWVIEDVELKRPENVRLSRILVENRQD